LRHITDLPVTPITFALQRYGLIYIVQNRTVSILEPNESLVTVELEFTPSTWASYGGSVVLLHPVLGIAQFSGKDLVLQRTGRRQYSAPNASPHINNVELATGTVTRFADINGIPVEVTGRVTDFVQHDFTLIDPVLSAYYEPGNSLVFQNNISDFSRYNGISGKLMYGTIPETLVPYVFPSNGILAAGIEDGYMYSPDMGTSWRRRKLAGFGIFTDKAILQAHPLTGVQVVKGWW